MRIPIGLALIAAVIAVVVIVVLGQALIQPNQPLITSAAFSLDKITPNADGSDDVTIFSYHLSRGAKISIALDSADGKSYAFRQNEQRAAGDYEVAFSGVVDGFTLPDDKIEGTVLRRLIPNGTYTWHLTARSDDGGTDAKTGTLVIADGDVPLPLLQNFTVSPPVFTPDQDGVADRVSINVFMTKDADLAVYLQTADGAQYYVPELQADAQVGKAGRHTFDYDGGVDQGADPPPPGNYTMIAEAQDAVGQKMRVTTALTIGDGGKPRAQIMPQPSGADVVFVHRGWDAAYTLADALIPRPDEPGDNSQAPVTVPLGDLLVFKLTVENYSDVPIRTTGPVPGTIYNQTERASTLHYYESAGAWRIGIDCENAISDYPWRWAIGTDDVLTKVTDPQTGEVFKYLEPGQQSVVWGAVRMTDLIETSNPQQCWAGLIHEGVEITLQNANVGPREVELVDAVATPEATAAPG